MKVEALSLSVALLLAVGVRGHVYISEHCEDDYWTRRSEIYLKEDSVRIGGDLELTEQEQLANQVIMDAKIKELAEGFHAPNSFLPAQNFLEVKDQISQSPVFKIIRKMPKGAVLHTHDYLMTSFDYLFQNITYRPNLYVSDVSGALQFKFLEEPQCGCEWELLSEVREQDETINARILRQLKVLGANAEANSADGYISLSQLNLFWESVYSLVTYRPVFEDYIYKALLELYEDNVFYMELHTALSSVYDLDGKEYDALQTARMYKEVTERFIEDHPDFVGIKLIYTINRTVSDSEMDEYLSEAVSLVENMPGFVVGLDLVYPEARSTPLAQLADKLRMVAEDVPFFLHAGESNWNGQITDENLIDAVLLGTKRIGNGYDLIKHPAVLELIRKEGIAIEILPVSNQVYSLVKDLRNHPATVLFANNYPVVIANGSPGMWGGEGLSYDFYEAFVGMMSLHADLRALKKLALNSIEYSSMSTSEKNDAMAIWQRKWNQFTEELAAEN